ncbi:MAG: hypothetical protein M3R48_04540 [Candidatus Dormibacteraeota bacterium]|nr:hypothetical protein [Candidatus Dormibacteraeota bacterium]
MSIIVPNLVLFFLVAALIGVLVAVGVVRHGSAGGTPPPLSSLRRECPACKELMRCDASVCAHCRTGSEPWTFRDGSWWVVRADATYRLDEFTHSWVRLEPPPIPS